MLEALQEELLVPKKPAHLKFMHGITIVCSYRHFIANIGPDRIQQAAYLTVDDKQRIVDHVKIGRTLLQAMKNDSSFEYSLFDVITHLNYGIEQMTDMKYFVIITNNEINDY